eukprot:6176549-Pleurochrysis_carterae.AAC.1
MTQVSTTQLFKRPLSPVPPFVRAQHVPWYAPWTRVRLVTPWGYGVWGAPPEAQASEQPALLAEFAGLQHLLRATLGVDKGKSCVRAMQSTRCNDNDQAHVAI